MSLTTLLPALWVLLLAGLLAWSLRRWWDPVPGRCWAVWGAAIALLFGAALAGGKVLLPLGYLVRMTPFLRVGESLAGPPLGNLPQSDLVLETAPWLELVRGAFADGRWPLWNHLAAAGEPLLGNPQSQALQPLAWLALVFPVAAAAGVLAALRVLLALVFTFLFLRRHGIGVAPATAGSLVFGLGGYLLGWVGWPLGGSAAFLPAVLYALAVADQRGARRDVLLLAFALAGLVLVGHPETAVYGLIFAAAYGVVRLARAGAGQRWRRAVAWGGAGLLGLGLAAPALVPAASVLPRSRRAELMEARRARLQAQPAGRPAPVARPGPVSRPRRFRRRLQPERDPDLKYRRTGVEARIVSLVAPNAFGNPRFRRYWGERGVTNDSAGWTGTAALLAALVSLVPPGRTRDGRRRRLPQEGLAAATALLCLVVLVRPPGLDRMFAGVPGLGDSMAHHSRVSLLLTFCTAWLAACTWERWRRGELRRTALAPAGLALAGLISWGYLAHPHPRDPQVLAGLRRGSLALHLATLAAAGLLLAVRRRPAPLADPVAGLPDRTPAAAPAWAAAGLVLLAAAEPLAIRLPVTPAAPADLFYPVTTPLRFVQRHLGPGERIAGLGPTLRPNVAVMYGLADARSSNPARSAALLDAISRVNQGETQASDEFTALDDPLYDLLGVRFLLTGPGERLPPPLWPVFKRRAGWVWERPHPLPRLFLPAAASGCGLPRWSACTAGVADFAAMAVLREQPAPWSAADPAGSTVAVASLEPARIRATARLAEPRLLASSVYQDGGWALLAGGHRLPTTVANGPFLAAWLPAGAHEIELVYRPQGLLTGLLLAALAVAAGLAVAVPTPLPRSRRVSFSQRSRASLS